MFSMLRWVLHPFKAYFIYSLLSHFGSGAKQEYLEKKYFVNIEIDLPHIASAHA